MYRNLFEVISNTTALSLAGKGTVVAEKRSIRSTPNKCEFLGKELNYLGHVITGVKPDNENTDL
jgi:hypothetical protein